MEQPRSTLPASRVLATRPRRAWALVLAALLTAPAAADSQRVGGDCAFHGRKLWGKVQLVQHFPDVKVKIVEHFPDLKVAHVEHFPDACGEWQLVEHFPDFKVQLVEHFEDLSIQWVEHFPGLP